MSGAVDIMMGSGVGTLRSTLVAGTAGSGATAQAGYDQGLCGTLSPNTDLSGRTISEVTDFTNLNELVYSLNGLGADPGKSAFTTLIINGAAGQKTFASSAATYSFASTVATWTWTGTTYGFVSLNTYTVQAF